jgi:acetyl coenzyme A synthetase (ADP forming)-like protein
MAKPHPLYIPAPYQDSAESGRLILRDGSTAAVRIATSQDAGRLAEFFKSLSPESRHHRFFSAGLPSPELVHSLCDSSKPEVLLTLLITRQMSGDERIVAAGSYIAKGEKSAEIAMAVQDEFQGKGIGTQLLERLALLAARSGFSRFWAVTQVDNRSMIDVFHHSGFQLTDKADGPYLELDFSVVPTAASVEHSEVRDRVFTAASLRPFFNPTAVAVIGASRDPASIGYRVLQALVSNRFNGPVYPVNSSAAVVGSMRSYASISHLPERVDLAVITVPRDAVFTVIDECARAGVRAVVIITAGFAEVDGAGPALQAKLVEKIRGYGMRMVGPNCMGLLNADPSVQLNASFSPVFPPSGRIAMSSQSGALGLAILALAKERNLGISSFVSVGNKADVSGNDLLQYWEVDKNTDVILLYLESFGNPRRFARIARRVGRAKPIVAVKAGRTFAGKRAAGSHTAALAANDVAVDALFRQTGVIRAETLDEMFDIASALANQPLMRGKRVGIVTNAGGPGILCTDACEAGGLVIPELSQETRICLQRFLPAAASVSNPVDMIASAGPASYRDTIEALLPTSEIDALVIIYIPIDVNDSQRIAEAIRDGVQRGRAAGGVHKPVLACIMDASASNALMKGEEVIPTYRFPEAAAKVLAKTHVYGEWRKKPLAMVPGFSDIKKEVAESVIRQVLKERGGGWLQVAETRAVLEAFGIHQAPSALALTSEQAAAIANEVGFPVAAKLASAKVLHKTEAGAVRLNLGDAVAVARAFESIQQQDMEGVLIQKMVSGGVEVMIGVTDDPLFGPLIVFGLGGIHVEILGDVRFRVTPLTDTDAREMIQEIRGYRLLQGYRGHAPADIPALEEMLLRVSRMVEDIPEIRELDLNPIFALAPGEGCRIVDARMRVSS